MIQASTAVTRLQSPDREHRHDDQAADPDRPEHGVGHKEPERPGPRRLHPVHEPDRVGIGPTVRPEEGLQVEAVDEQAPEQQRPDPEANQAQGGRVGRGEEEAVPAAEGRVPEPHGVFDQAVQKASQGNSPIRSGVV